MHVCAALFASRHGFTPALCVLSLPDWCITNVAAPSVLQVYKGIWQGNTPVAVKFVTGHSPKEQQRFRNEVAILKSLRHVNIVQFLGASMAGDQIMLVTEYMPRGDLWRALSQDSTHHFSWRNMCASPHSLLALGFSNSWQLCAQSLYVVTTPWHSQCMSAGHYSGAAGPAPTMSICLIVSWSKCRYPNNADVWTVIWQVLQCLYVDEKQEWASPNYSCFCG